jgi:CubicO group peptidase (beta-lactamase class C family)
MKMMPEIDVIMHELIKANEPGAAVAVVQAGEVIHRQGYGLANVEWEIPIQPDTVFRLASLTKQFTATAIMLLQEQGKLTVDDLLTEFLPEYPTSGHEITVHHLLTHTSGIKSYTSIEGWFPHKIIHDMTPQAICDVFSQIPFDFKPSTQFLYNNSGYHLLGMIIEKVSGVSYEQFIQENIFRPLGMQHSYYMSNEPIIPKRASGYATAEQGFRNADYLSMTQPYAAGSLGSTIDDLVVWDRAVREHRLVSAATQTLMFTPVKLTTGKTENYGYGWGLGDYRGQPFVHHGGGINGFSTFIAQFQQAPLSIIMLTNRAGFDVGNCGLRMARLVLGLPPLVREPVVISAAAMERVTGTYAFNKRWPWVVTQQDDQLILKTDKEEKLLPLSETAFYLADNPEGELHFSKEKAGKFQQLAIKSPLASLLAPRITEI